MLRASALLGTTLLITCLGGCAPAPENRDLEFQLRKVEGERDAFQQRLAGERAKSLALQKRMETEERRWNATRAQASALNTQVKKLTQANDELKAVLDQLKNRRLRRPPVPPSPLPSDVDQALQAFADQLPGRVWYARSQGAISFANDRLFDTGSDTVRSGAHAALHELAAILATTALADHEIIVVGHTDATPISTPETLARHPSNWHLSVHRAIAVKDVLVDAGLSPSRLGVAGYAQYRPLGDDHARNRRVEIFIVRKGAIQPFYPIHPTADQR